MECAVVSTELWHARPTVVRATSSSCSTEVCATSSWSTVVCATSSWSTVVCATNSWSTVVCATNSWSTVVCGASWSKVVRATNSWRTVRVGFSGRTYCVTPQMFPHHNSLHVSFGEKQIIKKSVEHGRMRGVPNHCKGASNMELFPFSIPHHIPRKSLQKQNKRFAPVRNEKSPEHDGMRGARWYAWSTMVCVEHGGMREQFMEHDGTRDQLMKHGGMRNQFMEHGGMRDQLMEHGGMRDQFMEHGGMRDQIVEHGGMRDQFMGHRDRGGGASARCGTKVTGWSHSLGANTTPISGHLCVF